jgi:hypothetical protein
MDPIHDIKNPPRKRSPGRVAVGVAYLRESLSEEVKNSQGKSCLCSRFSLQNS